MVNAITTSDLTRRFGRHEAVKGLTLDVPCGSLFALVGPNGAGKTTTIKVLMNLLRPSRGSATVLGIDSRRLTPHGFQRIGYVSENQRLPNHLSTEQLLDYCRPFYDKWDKALVSRLQTVLSIPMRARLNTLSRGTRMKAALLAALSHRPDVVVLDEPFSGLDPLVRDELVNALLELTTDEPTTVFVSSHDIEEVEKLADCVGFIENGRVLFTEEVSSLLRRFRVVEVIAADGPPVMPSARNGILAPEVAGRTLRFVDQNHQDDDAIAQLKSAYPGAEIRVTTMSLREIFVVLARQSKTGQAS